MKNTDRTGQLKKFRIRNYQKLLKELDDYARDLHRPLLPFLTNRKGEYSEKKLQSLISGLVAGLKEDYPVYTDAAFFPHTDALYEFYKSILYCTIRACSTPFTLYSGGHELGVCPPELTFGYLVEVLQPEQFEIMEDGEPCALCYPVYDTLSLVLTALYRILAGQSASGSNPLEEALIPLSDSTLGDTREASYEKTPDDDRRFVSDDFFSGEAAYYAEYEKELSDRIRAEEQTLLESFPYASAYCRNYKQLQQLFPECYHREAFGKHIRFMIEHFLSEQGDTVFDDEASYLTMLIYLQKNIQALKG